MEIHAIRPFLNCLQTSFSFFPLRLLGKTFGFIFLFPCTFWYGHRVTDSQVDLLLHGFCFYLYGVQPFRLLHIQQKDATKDISILFQ